MENEGLYRLVKEIHKAEYAANVLLTRKYDALLEEKSAVSQLLGKLEKGGYTKRTINPQNRREIFVELDKRGVEFIAKQRQIEQSIIARFYTKMSLEDLLAFHDITTRFKQIVEEELGRESTIIHGRS